MEGLEKRLKGQFTTAITVLLSDSPSKRQQPTPLVLSVDCAVGWGGYQGPSVRTVVASPGEDPPEPHSCHSSPEHPATFPSLPLTPGRERTQKALLSTLFVITEY